LQLGADGALADAQSLRDGGLAHQRLLQGHSLEAFLQLSNLGRARRLGQSVRQRLDGLCRAARVLFGRRLEQQLAVLPRQPDGRQRLFAGVVLAATCPLLPLKVLDDPGDVLVTAQTTRRSRHLNRYWHLIDCFIVGAALEQYTFSSQIHPLQWLMPIFSIHF